MTTTKKRPALRALEYLRGQPWAITPAALEQIVAIARRANEDPEAVAAKLGRELDNTYAVTVRNGVATIPIAGPLFRYANLFTQVSGATSYETLARDVRAALEDPNVRAILLDVDSPGGEVNGAHELGEQIYAARGQKPIVAYVGGMGASAAYWLSSAADEVVADPAAVLGSIGVIAHLWDDSVALENEGIRITTLVSSQSPDKDLDPNDPDDRAKLQRTVDDLGAVIVRDIARNRGVTERAVLERFGRGDVLVGEAAVRAGLADRLGSYEELHRELEEDSAAGPRLPMRRAAAAPVVPQLAATLDVSHVHSFASALRLTPASARRALPVRSAAPGAQPVATPAPDKAIHEERTAPMKLDAAAPSGAPTPTAEAETERVDTLTALAEEHNVPMATVRKWIRDKITVQAALGEIATGYRDNVRRLPQPGAEDLATGTRVRDVTDREADRPFTSLGEQLTSIARAGTPGGSVDPRLLKVQAAASGGSAGVGSDGGFAIQKDFTLELMKEGFGSGILASRCSQTEIGPNADGLETVYIDETSRATGSRWGGVQIYRAAEAETVTAKKPKIGKWECRLEDLMGVAYMTERLLQDAPAMQSVFEEAFRDEFAFVLDDEIYRGNGAAQCLGLLNAPALVTVAKETGQLADTVVAENFIKMWARILPRAKANGAWFINTECTPELHQMQIGTGTSGQLVYLPPGGLSASPYGSIYGRSVIEIEHASALGDVGDVSFADLSYYKLISKGGIQQAESIHVRFLYNERAFRWVARVNGAPKLKSAITPYKGASGNTLSAFVTLAART